MWYDGVCMKKMTRNRRHAVHNNTLLRRREWTTMYTRQQHSSMCLWQTEYSCSREPRCAPLWDTTVLFLFFPFKIWALYVIKGYSRNVIRFQTMEGPEQTQFVVRLWHKRASIMSNARDIALPPLLGKPDIRYPYPLQFRYEYEYNSSVHRISAVNESASAVMIYTCITNGWRRNDRSHHRGHW